MCKKKLKSLQCKKKIEEFFQRTSYTTNYALSDYKKVNLKTQARQIVTKDFWFTMKLVEQSSRTRKEE